jgi:hypothetical protein
LGLRRALTWGAALPFMTVAVGLTMTAAIIAFVGSGPGSLTMGTTTMTAGRMRPITMRGAPTPAPTPTDTSRAPS